MDILKEFPGRYINVDGLEELGGEVTSMITKVVLEDMKNQAGQNETKPVMYLEGLKPGLVLNKSNATTLAEEFGRETSAWEGKRVTIRLEQWGPAAMGQRWMAVVPANAKRPTRKVVQKAQAPLDLSDLDDDNVSVRAPNEDQEAYHDQNHHVIRAGGLVSVRARARLYARDRPEPDQHEDCQGSDYRTRRPEGSVG